MVSCADMKHSIEKLPKSLVEISFSVTPEEYLPYLKEAAQKLSEEKPVEGFRPGKASYEIVKQRYGEAKILEYALPAITGYFYTQVATGKNLETIGEPAVSVSMLSPGEALEFKLTVAVLPEVKLCDWKKIHIDKKEPAVTEESIDLVVHDLRKMQTKEVVVDRAATVKDKVVVDLEMLQDGVPLEGGAAKNHAIYLGEKYYVPGLARKIVGIKAGETREFSLEFPSEHYQKQLAGKLVDFKITARDVYELQPPELDDAFANGLGQKTMTGLRGLLGKNLRLEAMAKEEKRQEKTLLEEIVRDSRFDNIPEILANAEAEKMVAELERGVAREGLEFNAYLQQINKSLADLKLGFAPEAIKRVRVALVIRAVGKQENVQVADTEVVEEATRLMNMHKNDAAAQKEIRSEEYHENLRGILKTRKTIKLMRGTCVK